MMCFKYPIIFEVFYYTDEHQGRIRRGHPLPSSPVQGSLSKKTITGPKYALECTI